MTSLSEDEPVGGGARALPYARLRGCAQTLPAAQSPELRPRGPEAGAASCPQEGTGEVRAGHSQRSRRARSVPGPGVLQGGRVLARNVELDEGEGGQASRPDPQLPAPRPPVLRAHCSKRQAPQYRGVSGGRAPGRAHVPSSLPHARLAERLGQGAAGPVRLHLCSGAMLCTQLAHGRIMVFSRPRRLFALHTATGGCKPVRKVDRAPRGGRKTAQRRGWGPDRDGTWTSSRWTRISFCVKKGSRVGPPGVSLFTREGSPATPSLCVS